MLRFYPQALVLLALWLANILIIISLMITTVVAIVTVHWTNGFEAGLNGFEIPLYYLLMLFTLLILGPGKASLNKFIRSKSQRTEKV